MESVVLHKGAIFDFLFPNQGQGSKPSAAAIYTKLDQVPSFPHRKKKGLSNWEFEL